MNNLIWSYAKITDAAGERIRVFARLARGNRDKNSDGAALSYGLQAEGAFEVWCAIAGGARQDVDTNRLRTLVVSAQG